MGTRSPIGRSTRLSGLALGGACGALLGACALAEVDSGPRGAGGSSSSASSQRSSASSGGGATGAGAMGGGALGGGAMGGGAMGGASPASGSSTSQASSTAQASSSTANSSSSTGPTQSCNDEYGSAPGYVFCVETPTTCDFNLNTGQGTISCGTFCTSAGGQCVIEMDNLGACDLNSQQTFDCTDSHFGTTLCRCTHF